MLARRCEVCAGERVQARLRDCLAKLANQRYSPLMSSYSIGEAKTQLSKLVHQAEAGEEVVVRRGPKPVARIIAISEREPAVRRKPGAMRGRIKMHEDFDEWPPDVARALGIVD